MLRPWQGVICAESAHLNVDEGGAPEVMGGIKLLTVPTPDGKLTPELVARRIVRIGDEHVVQPGVVSVTQSTELGTLYSIEELRALGEQAHAHGMLFHIDGSRLANAAASLDCELRAITTDVGADVVSLGGTKIGMLAAEAVIVLNPELAPSLLYLRKQSMQLASKMRFVSRPAARALRGRRVAPRGRKRQRDGGTARRRRSATRSTITQDVQANARLRDPPAGRGRDAPARLQVLRLGRAHRRGALDVLVGHDGGGRRRVRRRDPRRSLNAGDEHRGL